MIQGPIGIVLYRLTILYHMFIVTDDKNAIYRIGDSHSPI